MYRIDNPLDPHGAETEIERIRGILNLRIILPTGQPISQWASLDIEDLRQVLDFPETIDEEGDEWESSSTARCPRCRQGPGGRSCGKTVHTILDRIARLEMIMVLLNDAGLGRPEVITPIREWIEESEKEAK